MAASFNNDNWPDVDVACDQTPSLLYENKRDGTFVEHGVEAGIAVDDFDGDGFLDIAETNFSGELPSLYCNEDGRFFQDIAVTAGLGANLLLGWGVAAVDGATHTAAEQARINTEFARGLKGHARVASAIREIAVAHPSMAAAH